MTEDGDPGGRHVADRRAVVGELFLTAGQPAQDLVPVRVRDVLETLHDESVRLASFAQADQLVDRPVAVGMPLRSLGVWNWMLVRPSCRAKAETVSSNPSTCPRVRRIGMALTPPASARSGQVGPAVRRTMRLDRDDDRRRCHDDPRAPRRRWDRRLARWRLGGRCAARRADACPRGSRPHRAGDRRPRDARGARAATASNSTAARRIRTSSCATAWNGRSMCTR